MRVSVVGTAVCGLLLLTGIASGAPSATSFTDSAGDANSAPDITSVTVSEPVAGTLSVVVAVGNFQALPGDSWFNIWFDTDRNPATGDAGDEALVRFLAGGEVEHYVWNGTELSQRPPTGITGSFATGTLTVTIPKATLGVTSFGLLAVASRGQEQPGNNLYIASDFAPDQSGGEAPPRSPWTGPTATFPDAANDYAAAPDITRVQVTDAKNGWIRFAISTPNRATLPAASVMLLGFDVDNRAKTGSLGTDVAVSILDGSIDLQRWNPRTRRFAADKAPTRIKGRNASSVVTIEVHRSELDNAPRFGFQLTGLDFDATSGDRQALDIAPNNGGFWRYSLANPAAIRLLAGRAVGTPARPRAGAPFTISVPVKRSDTGKAITSGTVTCKVTVSGARVAAKGKMRGGKAQCTLRVPPAAAAVRGSLTVRSAGATVVSRFSFSVV